MKKFDYKSAIGQLERLELEIQDPATPLDKVEELIRKANAIVADCRQYLRSAREEYEENL
ncbi:MAG: hypothetical protein MJY61_02355 [Bacteroidales bacterium]|nr:hypothetical protein [Bacteroidales bacterium]